MVLRVFHPHGSPIHLIESAMESAGTTARTFQTSIEVE